MKYEEPDKIPSRNRRNKPRLPNGFGQISKINKKNLRNKYRAMVTVGKTEDGAYIRSILKPKGYFKTYNEAYAALIDYNRSPYDLDRIITVKELYEKWKTYYFDKLTSNSSKRTIKAAWSYCSTLHSLTVREVRPRHLKICIEHGCIIDKNGLKKNATDNTKSRIKSLFNMMFDYAVEHEMIDKNPARAFLTASVAKKKDDVEQSHIDFTDDEISILWKNKNKIPYVDVILIQCYTGLRPQELGLVLLKNVNLEDKFLIAGMKTDAGRDRIVPIHSKIIDLIENRYKEAIDIGSEYLINAIDSADRKLTYDKYRFRFNKVVKKLSLNADHRPHDCRFHFVSMAKKSDVNEYAIKHIVGHAISDITEKIYTKRDANWLKNEIEKIK